MYLNIGTIHLILFIELQIYRTHMESALCYSFPDLYSKFLALMLQGVYCFTS